MGRQLHHTSVERSMIKVLYITKLSILQIYFSKLRNGEHIYDEMWTNINRDVEAMYKKNAIYHENIAAMGTILQFQQHRDYLAELLCRVTYYTGGMRELISPFIFLNLFRHGSKLYRSFRHCKIHHLQR